MLFINIYRCHETTLLGAYSEYTEQDYFVIYQ